MSSPSKNGAVATSGQAPIEQGVAQHSPGIYLLLLTVPIIWGFNFICLKILYRPEVGFTVPGMLSARYIIMLVGLGLCLLFLEKDWRIDREDWKYLIIFAVVTVGIYQYLFAKAIELTSASESALLISTSPIWAFLISLAIGLEKFDGRRLVGVMVGFLGIGLVIYGGAGGQNIPETHILGDAVMIVSAILWAAYAVFSPPLLKKYSPMKIVAWVHILGAVMLIPIGFSDMMKVDLLHMGVVPWICILQYSVLAGVYAFIVWYQGVQKIGAAQTMLFQYLVPPLALAAAYLILREVPTWVQVAGMSVTLIGIHLARKRNGIVRRPG